MNKEQMADKLSLIVYQRIKQHKPNYILTNTDKDCVWWTIYGKLCRDESYKIVKNFCEKVKIRIEEQKTTTIGYCNYATKN